jgi:glycosyltransferase involved in cell wall biosynthesis
VPVIASRTGVLPEIVGKAGIIVEPRDGARLAAALRVVWAEGAVRSQLVRHAGQRAAGPRRTWRDVAHETRAAYAAALVPAPA